MKPVKKVKPQKERLKKEIKPRKKVDEVYGAKDIYVLEGLEPVRRRPGMYIGSTGSEGLHHLIWECCDNCLDEFLAGYGNRMTIKLLSGNRVSVEDNGRGIPVEKHPQTKKSALETVMTTLHAGAKFGGKSYKIAGGLHGVGVSVVCALSSWLRVEVRRGGFKYFQEYSRGRARTKVKRFAKCPKEETGTTVIFEPDAEVFSVRGGAVEAQKGEAGKEIKFDWKRILNHLRQQAYLVSRTQIKIFDETSELKKSYEFYFEGGLVSYIRYLNSDEKPIHPNIFSLSREFEEILVEGAIQYTQDIECHEEGFANNIYTGEGGMHLTGLRTAITRTFNDYARKSELLKENDENLTGDDVREGLTAVISVKLKEPQFEGQTKAKLGNPEVRTAVETIVSQELYEFLERNPQDARAIIGKCIISAKARKAAKAAKDTVLRKGVLEGFALPGKLADCSSRKSEESEIFLVEGDSAGGSCFSEETKVALADGRNLSFKELIREDKKGIKNYCYTIKNNGTVGIELIKSPRRTKPNVEVIKIILDNNKEIVCTPNHRFMLRNGDYKMAKDLIPADSLRSLYRKYSKKGGRITIDGYEMVFDNKKRKWIFTHLLSDKYNLEKGIYLEKAGCDKHHIDFNKLNNNPGNIKRMPKEEHWDYHRQMLEFGLHREDVKEKAKKAHQVKEYKEKIKQIMTTPKMKKMLSERAKKQWENEDYKRYMGKKFLNFYNNSPEYRRKNNKLLNKMQKEYWARAENKRKQAERVKKYFEFHPEKKKELSIKAKSQWQNPELLSWRAQKTKAQWTPKFRTKRKIAYNQTYQEKALKLMKEIFEKYGELDKEKYTKEKLEKKDRNLLKYETICQRFFNGNEKNLKEAILNYNHRIKKTIKLKKKIDVYDLEVEGTHNFALASGIFVHNCKMARDRQFQAILPLRGKILNVERARIDKILSSQEIKTLIIAIGTGIGEDFALDKLRYKKIVIMADADSDGNHIRTLLLTLFYRYFKPLIEAGHLYIAQPPLYRIRAGKRIEYVYNEDEKTKVLAVLRKTKEEKAFPVSKKKIKEEGVGDLKISGLTIQRYKGLGEMNPEQLWETTMDPQKRILKQVTIEDVKEADHIFDVLMGEEVAPRKRFIQTYAKKVKNLDI